MLFNEYNLDMPVDLNVAMSYYMQRYKKGKEN